MSEAGSGWTRTLLSAEGPDDELDIPVEPVFYEAPPVVAPRPPAPMLADVAVAPPPAVRTAPPATPAPSPIETALPAVEPGAWAALREVQWRTFRWQTWQLAVVCLAALVIGMMIGYASLSSSSSSSRAGGTTQRASTAPTTAPQATQTSAVPTTAVTATTTPGSTPAASAGHAILLDLKRETGPVTTQHFTVTGARWTLGWAYDCTASGGSGSFKVSIHNADGSPSTDGGVDQQGAKGSSVAAYTSSGERFLVVDTACLWAVKVTS